MIAFISRFTERAPKAKPLYLSRIVSNSRPSLLSLAGDLAADMSTLNEKGATVRASRIDEKWEALKALDGAPGITVRTVKG